MSKTINLGRFDYGEISDQAMFSTNLKENQYALKKANNVFIDDNSGVKKRSGTKFLATGKTLKDNGPESNVYFQDLQILGAIEDVNTSVEICNVPKNTLSYASEYSNPGDTLLGIGLHLQTESIFDGQYTNLFNRFHLIANTVKLVKTTNKGISVFRNSAQGTDGFTVQKNNSKKKMSILSVENFYRHISDGVNADYTVNTKNVKIVTVSNFATLGDILDLDGQGTPIKKEVSAVFIFNSSFDVLGYLLIDVDNLIYNKDRFIGTKGGRLIGFNSINYIPTGATNFPDSYSFFTLTEFFTLGQTIDEAGTQGVARSYYSPMSGYIISPLGDSDVNFNWITSGRYLMAGSNRGLWIMSKEMETVTIDNAYMKNVSKTGTGDIIPVFNNDFIYFFTPEKRTMVKGKFIQGEFVGESRNILSYHIFEKSKPVKMVSAEHGLFYIFVLKENGTISVYHESFNGEFYGWTNFTIDGTILDISSVRSQIILKTLRVTESGNQEYYECFDFRNNETYLDCFVKSTSGVYASTNKMKIYNAVVPIIKKAYIYELKTEYKIRNGLIYDYSKIEYMYTGKVKDLDLSLITAGSEYFYIIGGEQLSINLRAQVFKLNFLDSTPKELTYALGVISGDGITAFKNSFTDSFRLNFAESDIILHKNIYNFSPADYYIDQIVKKVDDLYIYSNANIETEGEHTFFYPAITTPGLAEISQGFIYEGSITPRLFFNLYNGKKSRIHGVIPVVLKTSGIVYRKENNENIYSTFNSEEGELFTGLGERTQLSSSMESVPEIEILAPVGGSMNITSIFMEVE